MFTKQRSIAWPLIRDFGFRQSPSFVHGLPACDYKRQQWPGSHGETACKFAEGAPANVRPGSPAAVVGFSEQHERLGSYLQEFPSGVVYTVEFEDGSDAEVHEDHLAPLASNDDLR
jgi:hypothetical protein